MYGRVLLPVKSLFPEAFSLRHCVRTTLAPPPGKLILPCHYFQKFRRWF